MAIQSYKDRRLSRFGSPQSLPVPDGFDYHEDHAFCHPLTGKQHWGTVVVTSQLLQQSGGPILLRAGRHYGPHRGFGIRHIWQERGHDLARFGYPSIYDVPRFVSDVIVDGAIVVCEFNEMAGHHRLIVLRGRKGCVVLAAFPDLNNEDEIFYSVVTAYRNRATNGRAVAVVRA